MEANRSNEKRLPAKKEIDKPSSTSSKELHIDFSFRLFAAMAIKGAKPTKANNGNEGIIQARLNKMVPPTKREGVPMLFFFAIDYNNNFSLYFMFTKVSRYRFDCSSNGFLMYFGKLS